LLLLVAVFVAAVIVAVELSASNGNSTAIHFEHVVAHDAQSAINQLRKVINGYTK
jgi:hypothetical protein